MARRGKRTLVRAAMGLFSMLAGSMLLLRPFSGQSLLMFAVASGLVVAAVAEMVQGTRRAPARWLLGAMYLAIAFVVTVWTTVPLAVVAVLIGLLLLATGALEVWSGVISKTPLPALLVGAATGGMVVSLVTGVVTIALGVTSALWQDPVVLPMSMLLGTRLMLVGVGLLIDLWYPPTGFGAPTQRYRLGWRMVGLAAACAVVWAGVSLDGGRPAPSEFYYREVSAATAAGTLLRAEPTGEVVEHGTVVRVLYASSDAAGHAVAASGLLYVPSSTTGSDLPLVVWAHGETGASANCAPSVLGIARGGFSVASRLLSAGYAVFAPDYLGLGAPGEASMLVAKSEAHAILDGVRAVAQVPGVRLGSAVLWGFSQGGHAALAAGEAAAAYAPDVKLVGIAVDAPITDPREVLASKSAWQEPNLLGPSVLASYAAVYPDVRLSDYLPFAEQLFAQDTATRCGQVGWAANNWASVIGAEAIWNPSAGPDAFGLRLSQNAVGLAPQPVLVTQGDADVLVNPATTARQVELRCRAGYPTQYRPYPGVGHLSPAREDSPQLEETVAWITARFAGAPLKGSCGS